MPGTMTIGEFTGLIDGADIFGNDKKLICCHFETRKYSLISASKEKLTESKDVPLSLSQIVKLAQDLEEAHLPELKEAKGLRESLVRMSENKEKKMESANFFWRLILKVMQCFCNFFHGLGFRTTASAAHNLAARLETVLQTNEGKVTKTKPEGPVTADPRTNLYQGTKENLKSVPTVQPKVIPTPNHTEANYKVLREGQKNEKKEKLAKPNVAYDGEALKSNSPLNHRNYSTPQKKRGSVSRFVDGKANNVESKSILQDIKDVRVNGSELDIKVVILSATGKNEVDFSDRNAVKIFKEEFGKAGKGLRIEILNWLCGEDLFTPEVMKFCLDTWNSSSKVSIDNIDEIIKQNPVELKPNLGTSLEGVILLATGKSNVDFKDEATKDKSIKVLTGYLEYTNSKKSQGAVFEWLSQDNLFTPEVLKICLDVMSAKEESNRDLRAIEIALNYYYDNDYNTMFGIDGEKVLAFDNESIQRACNILILQGRSTDADRVGNLILKLIDYPEYSPVIFCQFMEVFYEKDKGKFIDSLTLRNKLVEDYVQNRRQTWPSLPSLPDVFSDYLEMLYKRV